MMYRTMCVLLFLLAGFAKAAEPSPPTDHRVLIISVDGLRPDLLLRSHTPAAGM